MSMTRKWSLLTAVLVVAIVAAGWFVLIAPKRSEASGLRDQASSQEQQNAMLVQKLEVLKAQQAELPKQRAELANLRIQIPDNPALPSLIRDLTAAGRKVGASIDELTPQPPVSAPVTSSVVAAPQTGTATTGSTGTATTTTGTPGDTSTGDTSTGDTSGTTTGTTTGTTGAAAAPAAPTSTLFQVPLAVKVSGSYFELEQFVNKLEGLKRSFLVKGFELTPADSSGTTQEIAPGTLTLTIQGQVFLAPETTPASQPSPAASASAAE